MLIDDYGYYLVEMVVMIVVVCGVFLGCCFVLVF